jgi:cytoskeletal protein CcmA (bactofilin family)
MATFRHEEANSVYIGEGAELTGAVRARESVVVDGSFDGEIVCNHLVVGQGGTVKGKVNVATADIAGNVNAEIAAAQLMTVRATGRVEGKWDCAAIEVARGAVLNGSAHVAETAGDMRRESRAATLSAAFEPEIVEEEEHVAPAPAVVAPLREPPRLTKLNLRSPRRSVG